MGIISVRDRFDHKLYLVFANVYTHYHIVLLGPQCKFIHTVRCLNHQRIWIHHNPLPLLSPHRVSFPHHTFMSTIY